MLQKQPVSVKIGEQWRGDYSDFDFAGSKLALPISSFEIQKKVIDDSLLSVLNKHPLGYLVINECSVASDVRQKLSSDVKTLVMEGSGDSVEMIELLSNDESSKLNRVRFVKSKFGKAQANALSKFQHLFTVDLVKDDLKEDAFEGLASLSKLRRVGIEQCKFPAEAYFKFKKERPGVGINFTATAFLGVSANDPRFPARAGDFGPRPVDKKEPNIKNGSKAQNAPNTEDGCAVATVVAGEAAARAGMEAGDVILSVGDQRVKTFEELQIVIAQCEVGDEVAIKIRRDGEEQTLKATMGIRNDIR